MADEAAAAEAAPAEAAPAVVAAEAEPAPRSALEASIRAKGANSYYFAHAKNLGAGTTTTLNEGVSAVVGPRKWRGRR